MSEIEMKRIAGNMIAGYSAVLRYLEITKKGNIDQLRSTVSFAFGLSPRTAHERINLMIDSGAISIHGKIWVWNNKQAEGALLLKCIEDAKGIQNNIFEIKESSREDDVKGLLDYVKSKKPKRKPEKAKETDKTDIPEVK